MSDKGEKPLNHASETAPEPDGLGTPDRLPDPVQKKLARLCGRFVTRLRRDRELAEAARGDPATFRAALVKVVRSLFPVQLVSEGRSIGDVLREQVKDWDRQDSYARYLASKGLRQAVKRRRREHRSTPGKSADKSAVQKGNNHSDAV